MNKFKRMLALLLVVAAVAGLVACGEPAQTTNSSQSTAPSTQSTAPSSTQSTAAQVKITYRVRIVDEAGNPVVGAGAQLCKADGTCTTKETNEEGWAEFDNAVEEGYTANIAYLADYTEVNSAKQKFESGVLEMTLTLKVTYRVKVVDAEGKAVAGQEVTIANKDKYAYTVMTTDAEGYACFFNEVAAGYVACLGSYTSSKELEGVQTTAFEGDALELTLTK